MSTKVKKLKTFNEIVEAVAPNKNAARTAIRALNSYLGNMTGEPVPAEDLGRLTLNRLAGMTGVGDKTFMLICSAFYLWAKQ